MNGTEFNKVVEEQIQHCKDLLISKGTEYKSTVDRFHTFDVAAELQNCSSRQALAGMMAKHTVSVYDMCQGEDTYSLDRWEEKITDSINYLLLLKAMVIDEKAKKVKEDNANVAV